MTVVSGPTCGRVRDWRMILCFAFVFASVILFFILCNKYNSQSLLYPQAQVTVLFTKARSKKQVKGHTQYEGELTQSRGTRGLKLRQGPKDR